ncbi:MAG TPA: hypothetical protein VF173_19250 [Thermoanaerobaculia bacterium]|nr:hypothetical protein [Thermoanaerobaculia bacterium]
MTSSKLQVPTLGRFMRAALLAAGLALVFLASVPQTYASGVGHICFYYSDASHTTLVGEMGFDCCGRRVNQGVTSPYSVCGVENCLVPCNPQE